jgi:hypothetical protein
MFKTVALSALLASTAVAAQTPSSSGSQDREAADPDRRVCQAVNETGSRLGRGRVCLTRSQWEQQRRETRQGVERAQVQRIERQY